MGRHRIRIHLQRELLRLRRQLQPPHHPIPPPIHLPLLNLLRYHPSPKSPPPLPPPLTPPLLGDRYPSRTQPHRPAMGPPQAKRTGTWDLLQVASPSSPSPPPSAPTRATKSPLGVFTDLLRVGHNEMLGLRLLFQQAPTIPLVQQLIACPPLRRGASGETQ